MAAPDGPLPPPLLAVVLCGLPGAGKSTFTSQLRAALAGGEPLAALLQRWPGSAGQRPRRVAVEAVEFDEDGCRERSYDRLAAAIRRPVGDGEARVVVADDTMEYSSMRTRVRRLARDAGAAFAEIFLRCPLDVAKRRNAGRLGPARVSDESMLRVAGRLEPPEPSDCSVVLDAEGPDCDGGYPLPLEFLARSFEARLRPRADPRDSSEAEAEREASRQAMRKNETHQADLVLRRRLAEVVSGMSASKRGRLGEPLNRLRRELVDRVRRGEGDLDRLLFEFDQSLDRVVSAATSTDTEETDRSRPRANQESLTCGGGESGDHGARAGGCRRPDFHQEDRCDTES